MLYADLENLIGVKVERKRFGKPSFEFIRFGEKEEIFSFPGEKSVFFPDPFSLTLRFFDYPFGGGKAKKAAEIELTSEEEFEEGEKFLLWVPRKKGTTVALIYSAEVEEILQKGVSSVIFKPACLLALNQKYPGSIFAEVGKSTVSLAYMKDGKMRLGFFSYSDPDDIRAELNIFLSQIDERENISFRVCGPNYNLFPFEHEVVRPSEIIDSPPEDDPAFTTLVCAVQGKYPNIKLGGKRKFEIAPVLSQSLPFSVISFVIAFSLTLPLFVELSFQKQKRNAILREMNTIFQKTFPGRKIVDPYEQMKIEYSRMRRNGAGGMALPVFFGFSRAISDLVVRIEDFRFDGDEVSAQLKIKELSYVEEIRKRLGEIVDDVKVTSTVRSRDGKFFIMRVTGKIKRRSLKRVDKIT